MSDKNQFVLSGDNTGSVWVNNVLTYRASDLGMREIRIASVVAGHGISDALKLSGVRRLTVYVGTLDARAAAEDAIDINHCHDCSIHIGELWPARPSPTNTSNATSLPPPLAGGSIRSIISSRTSLPLSVSKSDSANPNKK
jgi:hypothetical protein